MINETITEAFNSQLNAELYSAYLYLSMSASLASQNLPGFAAWMRVQTREELEHSMKFYDYPDLSQICLYLLCDGGMEIRKIII